jgi:hypothetical protein
MSRNCQQLTGCVRRNLDRGRHLRHSHKNGFHAEASARTAGLLALYRRNADRGRRLLAHPSRHDALSSGKARPTAHLRSFDTVKRSWEPRRNVRRIASADWFANPTRPSNALMSIRAIRFIDSGSPTKVGLETFCLVSPPILGAFMFTFACIAGGLITACTVFALLVPSGTVVTLSDIARRMETKHRSPRRASFDIACGATTRETLVSRSD